MLLENSQFLINLLPHPPHRIHLIDSRPVHSPTEKENYVGFPSSLFDMRLKHW